MTRRNSSLGFLGLFGRSGDLRQLDQALRASGVHPALVPEGVKLTVVNLMKDGLADGDEPPADAYPPVAGLIAYCVHGAEEFERTNGPDILKQTERRVDDAIADAESLDAQLVLLTLHAKLINPGIVERHHITVEDR